MEEVGSLHRHCRRGKTVRIVILNSYLYITCICIYIGILNNVIGLIYIKAISVGILNNVYNWVDMVSFACTDKQVIAS